MNDLRSTEPLSVHPTVQALDTAGITALIHSFYADVVKDRWLGPLFTQAIGHSWDLHLERMVSFWSTVMLGTRSFKGNVFAKHMDLSVHHSIQAEHFYRWLTLWHQHTAAHFEPDLAREFQRTAQGIARNLFYGFLGEFASFIIQNNVVVGHVPDTSARPPR